MNTNQKFERRIKQVNSIGYELYGTSYVSFYRFMYFIVRVEIAGIDRETMADIDSEMRQNPELALYN